MAPIVKQKPAKQKPKFSQTRLTTTLLASSSSSSSSKPKPKPVTPTKVPFSAKKTKPNQSILNFFQKAPRPEEGLFVGESPAFDDADLAVEEDGGGDEGVFEVMCKAEGTGVEGDNIGASREVAEGTSPNPIAASAAPSPLQEGQEENGETRFNECGGSVKRRRLGTDDALSTMKGAGKDSAGENKKSSKPNTPATVKRRAGNPFLDDSDSESESDDNNSNKGSYNEVKQKNSRPGVAAGSSRVRLPQQPLLECDFQDDGGGEEERKDEVHFNFATGSARLTNGTTTSRTALPLREQTSDTQQIESNIDNSRRENADASDDVGSQFDSNDGGGDDFTNEELEMMREMEEQARLEMEGNDDDEEVAECEGEWSIAGGDDNQAMTECCPVCGGSLAGTTPDQATRHVNACLDGNPTPLPSKPPDNATESEAAASAGKRAARAAVPRPGQANPIRLDNAAGEGTSAFAKLMSGHAENSAWATAAAAEAASRGLPAYKRTCPFYKIMPGFSICVDAFRYGAVEGCKAYFLSHFHSDHYIGLTANWTHGPIYCSKVTAALVKSQLKTAEKYVVELDFDQTVPIPGTDATVTMIPANHCPGSSLFLFEKNLGGRTQRILHCGDFRACPAHVEHPMLRPGTIDAVTGRTKQQKIDVCYLDTTYLNPRYSFPPQSDVVNACAELCALLNNGLLVSDDTEWKALLRRPRGGGPQTNQDVSKFFTSTSKLSAPALPPIPAQANDAFTALNGRPHNPNRLLVVCGTYSIGKERLCVAIAKALRTRIYAAPAKLSMCRLLGDPELTALLTSDPADAQVHMQSLMDIGPESLTEYLAPYKAKGCFGRVVGFRPSGWNYRPVAVGSGSGGSGGGGGGNNSNGNGGSIGANLAPSSLPTTQLLHGPRWRPRFTRHDLVPQRGSGVNGNGNGNNSKNSSGKPNTADALCFSVPYSEHSSFRELALFLMALRIERVVPTVNVGSEASRKRMKAWIDRWLAERRRGGLVRVVDGDGSNSGGGAGTGKMGEELWTGKDGRGGIVYW
ncbi:hypothetical protein VTJ04DRAFT_5996 [Mycothermus thermophilus]|uniref:uncharacterized protein n=1 Tax=Humicola insolens TaxID=85995 RepID=UPI003743D939